MTDELPEMRASDAERERIADVLRDALAEGRLGLDEFQERLDVAYRARTRGELVPLVRDLPKQQEEGASAVSLTADEADDSLPAVRRKRSWAERIGGAASSRWGIGVMGGFSRKGEWTAPESSPVSASWAAANSTCATHGSRTATSSSAASH